jgi:hypothetical protein
MLTDVQGIDRLVSLQELLLESCSKLNLALDFTNLISLTRVELENCSRLSTVTGISKLAALADFTVVACKRMSISDESVGNTMAALYALALDNCSFLRYFERQNLPALESVFIALSVCENNFTLHCGRWPSLTLLEINDCSGLTTLQGLQQLRSLETLNLNSARNLSIYPSLLV